MYYIYTCFKCSMFSHFGNISASSWLLVLFIKTAFKSSDNNSEVMPFIRTTHSLLDC